MDEASHKFTTEHWDNIVPQVTTNPSLAQTILGDAFDGDDYVKQMVELGNQRKRAEVERKSKEKREKPMSLVQLRDFMRTFVKNQSSAVYGRGWTMNYVKGFSDAELIK